ncbi:UbiX family flavin prenyltransferase [uncultured Helicobacter sp.]|uniref:UbiX family flavin prenyltransferase n=1 Tax=uncultured Helicobacter sp. TaxID=175537 RepID=UPI00259A66E6|nr:UbiX family flavin prenyltransferase [uncultured Helicobacter sp.]
MKVKFVLGISGASGISLALGFLAVLKDLGQNLELFVVLSNGAKQCAKSELNLEDLKHKILDITTNARSHSQSSGIQTQMQTQIYEDFEMDAPIAAGSCGADMMAVIPTSMDCLAKIACGISDTLLTRTAQVMIKEGKKLLLAPREMPLSAIACNNMTTLANLGVIIAPPILGYYAKPSNLVEMEHFIFGKWLDSLGISNSLYHRWGE